MAKLKEPAKVTHIGDLTPDPANARRHNPRNIGSIVNSLHAVGAARSIVIDENNAVLAGNGLLEAAAEAGIEKVQVVESDGNTIIAVRRRNMTPAMKAQYAIQDNRTAELADWDTEQLLATIAEHQLDLSAIEFTEDELKALSADEPHEVIEDEAPELDEVEPRCKAGELWLLGDHRLLCGDSTKAEDVARVMDGKKADCVFTSPPYAVGIDYGSTYLDTIENLRGMLPELSKRWLDLVLDGGFAVVNFGDIVSGREMADSVSPCEYPMALEYWSVFRADGWTLWSRRVWCKPVARVAAPWCASSNRSAANYEHIWTWKKDGPVIVGRVPGPMDSQTGWFDTSRLDGVDVGKETHGAGMPVSTAAWMVNVHSRCGSVVHEPFCGTGTTIIAAEQLGRRCYAMEISPKYCDVAIARWEKLTGKTAQRA